MIVSRVISGGRSILGSSERGNIPLALVGADVEGSKECS